MTKNGKKKLLRQCEAFIVCFILMGVVAVSKNGTLFGISLKADTELAEDTDVISERDGATVINTSSICGNVIGYSGPTPVEIILRDGKISRITPLKNKETPEFFGAVMNSDFLDHWYGKPLEEAQEVHPDAVTGATITSSAIRKNIEAGIAYALRSPNPKKEETPVPLDFKFFFVIFIILAASIVPLIIRNKRYRLLQLVLNVILIGFWGGTFISYSLMTSLMANGIKTYMMIPVLLMLVTAFLYPFFGKPNHYCNWICPYGSIQELAGRMIKYKVKMSPGIVKSLSWFRDALWFCLMAVMWAGLWFDWMNWEPFAAFFFNNEVSAVVYSIAGGFLLLSFFISRPYCRFVCPTGTLFKLSEGSK